MKNQQSSPDFLQQNKQVESSEFLLIHLESGVKKEKLKRYDPPESIRIEDTMLKNSLKAKVKKNLKIKVEKESELSIQESQQEDKQIILKDNPNYSGKNSLIMNLLKILDRGSTSKEKDLKPFWNTHSNKNSKKLWLPIKTDCVDLDLTYSNSYLPNCQMLKSWFSTTAKHPLTKSWQKISYQSSQFSQPKLMEEKSMEKGKDVKKKEKIIKTIKARIYPTKTQIKILNCWEGLVRLYWNEAVWILKMIYSSPIYQPDKNNEEIIEEKKKRIYKHNKDFTKKPNFTKFKISNIALREFIRKVETKSEIVQNEKLIYEFVDYIYDENRSEFQSNSDEICKLPSRGYRGLYDELTQAINSIISNRGDINNLGFKYKKDHSGIIPFDQWCGKYSPFPSIGNIKGNFKIGRKKIKLSELFKHINKSSFSIQRKYDKYFLILPVYTDKFNELKRIYKRERGNENQVSSKHPLISLDTGVRTFQTGYALNHTVEIGKEDIITMKKLLRNKDDFQSKDDKKNMIKIQNRISSLVNELHWKTIGFLTKNYKCIILPEFPVSQMVRGQKLNKMIKRLMYTYRFYQFKQRLINKCKERGCKLEIVDESFTSKTCGSCGYLHQSLGGNKTYRCPNCEIVIDRDINGARNILIKNYLSD